MDFPDEVAIIVTKWSEDDGKYIEDYIFTTFGKVIEETNNTLDDKGMQIVSTIKVFLPLDTDITKTYKMEVEDKAYHIKGIKTVKNTRNVKRFIQILL